MRIFLVFYYTFTTIYIQAQKHDYIWTLGTGNTFVDSIHGGTDVDFNYSPPQVRYINRNTQFDLTNSSMCDADGNLEYYTNGCSVINSKQQTLINGDGINPGTLFDEFCTGQGYYIAIQSIISIPFNNNPFKYGMFHFRKIDVKGLINSRIIPCYYSEVDMSSNNGQGELIKKNIPIINDTLGAFIKAVKHADGQSWWIIAAGRSNNIYYRIKFKDGTFEGPYEQIVQDTCKNPNGSGQAVFSPDGSMYAHFDPWTGLIIYNFDRNTGLLSRKEKIDFWFDPYKDFYRGGLSFSPNNKRLYLSTIKNMYQFNLEQNPIKGSRILLDTIDGFESPYIITFQYHELAPDGKIYISSGNSVNRWGVINNPDELGMACNFKQHSFKLATLNYWCIPNFPNYRLGPLVSSNDKLFFKTYKPSPNPANNYFAYDQLDKEGILTMYNISGLQVLFQKLSPYYHMVYISQLPAGIYYTCLDVNGKKYWDKLMKI